jgi:hypothetical protein
MVCGSYGNRFQDKDIFGVLLGSITFHSYLSKCTILMRNSVCDIRNHTASTFMFEK